MSRPFEFQILEDHFGIMNHSTIIQYERGYLGEWVEIFYSTSWLPGIVDNDLMRHLLFQQSDADFPSEWAWSCDVKFHDKKA